MPVMVARRRMSLGCTALDSCLFCHDIIQLMQVFTWPVSMRLPGRLPWPRPVAMHSTYCTCARQASTVSGAAFDCAMAASARGHNMIISSGDTKSQ